MDILEWTAENVVADIVKTINHVTMSVECVLVVVRTGILRTIVIAVRNLNNHFSMLTHTFFFIINVNFVAF